MLLKNIGFGALGIGTLGVAIFGGYHYMNSDNESIETSLGKKLQIKGTNFKSIRESLANKKPLVTKGPTDNEKWGKLLEKHLDPAVKKYEKMKIEGISTESNPAFIEIFKHSCEELFSKEESEENAKEIAINWCTQESPLLKDPATDAGP